MISLYRSWCLNAERAEAHLRDIDHSTARAGALQRIIECWLKAADYAGPRNPEKRADARNRAARAALELHHTLSAPETGRRTA